MPPFGENDICDAPRILVWYCPPNIKDWNGSVEIARVTKYFYGPDNYPGDPKNAVEIDTDVSVGDWDIKIEDIPYWQPLPRKPE